MSQPEARIREFIRSLNDCWQRGDQDALPDYYHPDVVLLPPDLGPPIRGRDAVVASYRDFLEAARLDRFTVESLEVFSFPFADGAPFTDGASCCHMAHLLFDVSYVLGGERYLERGLEVYTIADTADRLQIIWRAQSVLDSRLAEKSDAG